MSVIRTSPAYDVAISGSGPTGATLAGLLGLAGLRVLVVEKEAAVHPQPRAVGFDQDAMRIFQRLGVADALAPHIAPFRDAQYLGLQDRVIQRVRQLDPPWPLAWRPNYSCDQPGVEAVLRRALAAQPGVDVYLGHELVCAADDGDRVRLRTRDAQGRERDFEAGWLVGCDGASSPLRRQLGIGLRSLDYDVPWIVVDVRVEPDALARLPETNVQYCRPERPSTHVVCPGNHRRWEFMLLEGERPADMARPARLWELLAPWLQPGEAELWRAAAYRFHALVAQRWRAGRVLLAGDAVHQTPPFMGQGMCQGIRDAGNLAWKLALVAQGRASASLLDTYEAERAPHVEATTGLAKELGVLISERDPQRARVRDQALLDSGHGQPPLVVRQSLIPGLTTGLIATTQPLAGTVFPQPRVRVVGGPPVERRLDDLLGETFRLVVADDLPDTEHARLARLATGAGVRVVRVVAHDATVTPHPLPHTEAAVLRVQETEAVLRPWLAQAGCVGAWVRPDHHTFGGFADVRMAADGLQLLLHALPLGALAPLAYLAQAAAAPAEPVTA